MEQLQFQDIEDFCNLVIESYDEIDFLWAECSIGIIAKYAEAKVIVEELISNGFDINSIRLNNPQWDGYKHEYWIYIDNDEIIVEPVKKNSDYLHLEASVVFVLDNCSSAVLPHIQSECTSIISIDEDDECDGDCENCYKLEETKPTEVPDNTKDVPVGNWESYFINGQECNKEEYDAMRDEIIKDFTGIKDFWEELLLSF